MVVNSLNENSNGPELTLFMYPHTQGQPTVNLQSTAGSHLASSYQTPLPRISIGLRMFLCSCVLKLKLEVCKMVSASGTFPLPILNLTN